MVSLENLTDKQNNLLTQLAYCSDRISSDAVGKMTLIEMYYCGFVKGFDAIKIVDQLIAEGLGSLRITDIGNNPATGFGAIAFADSNGNVGITYRGTDGPTNVKDMLDNLSTAVTGTSVQTVEAEAFFDKNRNEHGNNYLYGHSKGGELAESVFVNNYSRIKKAHLLNPQPINPYSLLPDQIAALNSSKMDIIVVEGDYVWFLGKVAYFSRIRVAKYNREGSFWDRHFEESIVYGDDGSIISGKQPILTKAGYLLISAIAAPFQRWGGKIGLIYNTAVRVIDYVKNDFIPKAKAFIVRLANRIRQMGKDLVEFGHRLEGFFAETIDKAKEWFKYNFNSGYKAAVDNPQIVVDTGLLREYAGRLNTVNTRIKKLDQRLDGLYWKVGLRGLWDLITADALTGYSRRLSRCERCLIDTASDFEHVEDELDKKL